MMCLFITQFSPETVVKMVRNSSRTNYEISTNKINKNYRAHKRKTKQDSVIIYAIITILLMQSRQPLWDEINIYTILLSITNIIIIKKVSNIFKKTRTGCRCVDDPGFSISSRIASSGKTIFTRMADTERRKFYHIASKPWRRPRVFKMEGQNLEPRPTWVRRVIVFSRYKHWCVYNCCKQIVFQENHTIFLVLLYLNFAFTESRLLIKRKIAFV
jgi:hypothetical protein